MELFQITIERIGVWYCSLVLCMPLFIVLPSAFFIAKFNNKTPRRETNVEDVKLHTKADYFEYKQIDNINEKIMIGLGGLENILDVDNRATRLRVSLIAVDKIDERLWKATIDK